MKEFCVKTLLSDGSIGELKSFRYIQYAKRYADMMKDTLGKNVSVIEIREGNDGEGRIIEAFYLS